jgi:hypothetical protein
MTSMLSKRVPILEGPLPARDHPPRHRGSLQHDSPAGLRAAVRLTISEVVSPRRVNMPADAVVRAEWEDHSWGNLGWALR